MRSAFLIALVATAAAASLSAQDKPKKTSTPKTITLTGCVAQATGSNQLTIEDETTGSYRLSGMSLRDYIGQKVEVAGSVYESKRLVIQGGLKPSANTAAQAGAIDQTQVADEIHGGSAPTGNVQLPEFRVKSIRPLGTGCR